MVYQARLELCNSLGFIFLVVIKKYIETSGPNVMDRFGPKILTLIYIYHKTSFMNQELLKQQIVGSFLSAKATNSRYSKRAYAKRLGIAHGPLVEIMNGKRNVSPKMALRLCERLDLSPKQVGLITKPEAFKELQDEYELKEDQFFLIADVNHFALLNLIKIKKQSHETGKLAKRLELSEEKVDSILERLLRLKLIEVGGNGNYFRTKNSITTSDEVLSLSIKASHKTILEMAANKLDSTPIDLRDFTSIVMPINTKKMKAAKELIRKFQDDLESLLEDSKADEVYSFNMQLIPLTKKGEQP